VFGVGAAQLESTLAAAGFTSLRRQDVSSPSVTPYDPDLHAAASSFTPLGQLLRRVRAGADEFGFVTDFVRAYAPTARRPAPRELPLPSCFLSVIVRNQGGRCQHLLEALTCLAAQTVDDLEVLVMVHDGHPDAIDRVEALVDLFDEAFAARISVIGVEGGRRSEPLVRGLAAARGAYAAFLDDDDHVTGHWVEAFRDGAIAAPGNVIRSRCGEQHHRDVTAPDAPAEWEATSAFSVTFANDWDLVEHLDTNRTPHHSFAVPLATVRHLGVTVDGDTPVLEDWGLLLRMAELCGVHDTGEVTAISQRWASADRSCVASTPEVWTASRTLLLDDLAAAPFVLPRGGVRRVVDADAQRAELDSLRDALASERGRAELAEAEAELAGAEAAQLAFRVRQFEQSEWWRMTGPMRHGIDRLRRRGR
jgi:hypothetical protein